MSKVGIHGGVNTSTVNSAHRGAKHSSSEASPLDHQRLNLSVTNQRQSQHLDLQLERLTSLQREAHQLRHDGQDTKKIESEIAERLKELESVPGMTKELFAKLKEGLDAHEQELKQELEIAKQLRDLSKENLSRSELETRLDEMPGVNKTEALKVIAKLELERERDWHERAFKKISIYGAGKDSLELDLSMSLDKPIPGESKTQKREREILLRLSGEREEALLSKYPDLLSKDLLRDTMRGAGMKGLVDAYLQKADKNNLMWEDIRGELLKAGVITPETENQYRENLFREGARKVLGLVQERFTRGLYLTPANGGDRESQRRVDYSTKTIAGLETKLERLIKDLPPGLKELEKELKTLRQIGLDKEVEGITAYHDFRKGEEERQLAEYEKMAREGGALFASEQILIGARDALPKLVESTQLLVGGNLAQGYGFVKGAVNLENPIASAVDTGTAYVEGSREFFNKTAWGGSTLGSDSELSSSSLYSASFKKLNPLAHFGEAVVSPAFGLIDVGRVEVSRRQIVGKVLFGDIQTLADGYYGVKSTPIENLSYAQYRELEQTDSLLKGARYSFKVAEIAGSLAVMRPESVGSMTRMLSGSVGMGVVGSVGHELMDLEGEYSRAQGSGEEWSFKWGRFLENTLNQTADSSVFMAGMAGFSRVFVSSRLGIAGSKLARGEALAEAELALVRKAAEAEATVFREFIDGVDGLGDLSEASVNFEEVRSARMALGAILNFATAASDVGDVNLGLGDSLASSIDKKILRSQIEKAISAQLAQGLPSVPSLGGETLESLSAKSIESLDDLSSLSLIDPTTAVLRQQSLDDKIGEKKEDVQPSLSQEASDASSSLSFRGHLSEAKGDVESQSRTKEEILRTPAVREEGEVQAGKYDRPVSEILDYVGSRKEVQEAYAIARTEELVREGYSVKDAAIEARDDARTVIAFFNRESGKIVTETPRTLREGETPSRMERLRDALIVMHELDHVIEEPGLSKNESELRSIEKRAELLNKLGYDLLVGANGSWVIVELEPGRLPIARREPGYHENAVRENYLNDNSKSLSAMRWEETQRKGEEFRADLNRILEGGEVPEDFIGRDWFEDGIVSTKGRLNQSFSGAGELSIGLPRIGLTSVICSNSKIVEIEVENGKKKVLELELECDYIDDNGKSKTDTRYVIFDKNDFNRPYKSRDSYVSSMMKGEIETALKDEREIDLKCLSYDGENNWLELGIVMTRGKLNQAFSGAGELPIGLPKNLTSVICSKSKIVEIEVENGKKKKVLEFELEYEYLAKDGKSKTDKRYVLYDQSDINAPYKSKYEYVVSTMKVEIETAFRGGREINLEKLSFGGENNWLELGFVGPFGTLNKSVSGAGTLSIGLLAKGLTSVICSKSKIVEIEVENGKKKVLELELECEYVDKNGETKGDTRYVIYDPSDNISPYKGKPIYEYIRSEIVTAFREGREINLEKLSFGGENDWLELGLVGPKGKLNGGVSGVGQLSIGLPKEGLTSATPVSTRLLRTDDGKPQLQVITFLCVTKDKSDLRDVAYDGRIYYALERSSRSASSLKGYALDLLLYEYMKSKDDGSGPFSWRPQVEINQFTGEVRQPNIVVGDQWVHAKWGPLLDTARYASMHQRAQLTRSAPATELLIYDEEVAKAVAKYSGGLGDKVGVSDDQRIRVLSLVDWLARNGLDKGGRDLISKIEEIGRIDNEDILKSKIEEIKTRVEISNGDHDGDGQIPLGDTVKWQAYLDSKLSENPELLLAEIGKLKDAHSSYWEIEYHQRVVLYSIYVLDKLEAKGEERSEVENQIIEQLQSLYPELGEIEFDRSNASALILEAVNRGMGEGTEGELGEKKEKLKVREFKLGDYLRLLGGSEVKIERAKSTSPVGEVWHGGRHPARAIDIKDGNVVAYLDEVMEEIRKNPLDAKTRLDVRSTVVAKIDSFYSQILGAKYQKAKEQVCGKGSMLALTLGDVVNILGGVNDHEAIIAKIRELNEAISRADSDAGATASLISGSNVWQEGAARSYNLENKGINYISSRVELENIYVDHERQYADKNNKPFNEDDSRVRAEKSVAFYSRLNNQVYSLAPETLQNGNKSPSRDTRIYQALAVIHELTHKKLEANNPVHDEQEALAQEIEVWKQCALYLKARGYEFRFERGGWSIESVVSREAADRQEVERIATRQNLDLSAEQVFGIEMFVRGAYKDLSAGEVANGRGPQKADWKGRRNASSPSLALASMNEDRGESGLSSEDLTNLMALFSIAEEEQKEVEPVTVGKVLVDEQDEVLLEDFDILLSKLKNDLILSNELGKNPEVVALIKEAEMSYEGFYGILKIGKMDGEFGIYGSPQLLELAFEETRKSILEVLPKLKELELEVNRRRSQPVVLERPVLSMRPQGSEVEIVETESVQDEVANAEGDQVLEGNQKDYYGINSYPIYSDVASVVSGVGIRPESMLLVNRYSVLNSRGESFKVLGQASSNTEDKAVISRDPISDDKKITLSMQLVWSRKGSSFEIGCPPGEKISHVQILRADVDLSGVNLERCLDGTYFISGLKSGVSGLVVSYEKDISKREQAYEAIGNLPKHQAVMSAGLQQAILSSKRIKDERRKAQYLASAFFNQGLVYSLDANFGRILDSLSPEHKISFLNGLNCGSCSTFSTQLHNLFSQAGLRSIVEAGSIYNAKTRTYQAPGHARVRVFFEDGSSLALDPTNHADESQILNVDIGEAGKVITSKEQAYEYGELLRNIYLEKKRRSSFGDDGVEGHSLRDDFQAIEVEGADEEIEYSREGIVERVSKELSFIQFKFGTRFDETLGATPLADDSLDGLSYRTMKEIVEEIAHLSEFIDKVTEYYDRNVEEGGESDWPELNRYLKDSLIYIIKYLDSQLSNLVRQGMSKSVLIYFLSHLPSKLNLTTTLDGIKLSLEAISSENLILMMNYKHASLKISKGEANLDMLALDFANKFVAGYNDLSVEVWSDSSIVYYLFDLSQVVSSPEVSKQILSMAKKIVKDKGIKPRNMLYRVDFGKFFEFTNSLERDAIGIVCDDRDLRTQGPLYAESILELIFDLNPNSSHSEDAERVILELCDTALSYYSIPKLSPESLLLLFRCLKHFALKYAKDSQVAHDAVGQACAKTIVEHFKALGQLGDFAFDLSNDLMLPSLEEDVDVRSIVIMINEGILDLDKHDISPIWENMTSGLSSTYEEYQERAMVYLQTLEEIVCRGGFSFQRGLDSQWCLRPLNPRDQFFICLLAGINGEVLYGTEAWTNDHDGVVTGIKGVFYGVSEEFALNIAGKLKWRMDAMDTVNPSYYLSLYSSLRNAGSERKARFIENMRSYLPSQVSLERLNWVLERAVLNYKPEGTSDTIEKLGYKVLSHLCCDLSVRILQDGNPRAVLNNLMSKDGEIEYGGYPISIKDVILESYPNYKNLSYEKQVEFRYALSNAMFLCCKNPLIALSIRNALSNGEPPMDQTVWRGDSSSPVKLARQGIVSYTRIEPGLDLSDYDLERYFSFTTLSPFLRDFLSDRGRNKLDQFISEDLMSKQVSVNRSYDFNGTREYQRGDPINSIDWNASARSAELQVREYYQPSRNQSKQQYELLVDGRMLANEDPEVNFQNMRKLHETILALRKKGESVAVSIFLGDDVVSTFSSERIEEVYSKTSNGVVGVDFLRFLYREATVLRGMKNALPSGPHPDHPGIGPILFTPPGNFINSNPIPRELKAGEKPEDIARAFVVFADPKSSLETVALLRQNRYVGKNDRVYYSLNHPEYQYEEK